MKEMELKNLKILRTSFLMAPLLISVSIFSLVLSWSSLSSLALVYYQNMHHFSTNTFHLISIAMSKNCIFLIFNGILVFLAKTSAFLCPPSDSDDPDRSLRKRIADQVQVVETEAETLEADRLMLVEESFRPTENDVEEDEEETENEPQEEDEEMEVSEQSNGGELQQLIPVVVESDEDRDGDGEDNEDEDEDKDEDEDEDEDEEGEEIEKLSNDELNQRFEDFIRKMKQEFKINQYHHHKQQQQLVLVK